MEIHGIVLEAGNSIKSAITSELRVASREVDVLVSEHEVDVAHVDAAECRESKAGATDSGQHPAASQRLRALGEDRSRGCRRQDRDSRLEPERFTAAGRADRDTGDADAECVGDDRYRVL